MYPSIDSINGINMVEKALDTRSLKSPSTECVIEGLSICLFNNNSVFANEHLLQTNGTATGAPNSCSYADLAVSPIDLAVTEQMNSGTPELRYFGRYRDDIFSLWCGSRDKLDNFFNYLNTLSDDLKFTMEVSVKEICFLDLRITNDNGKLNTTVYSKPTDSHLYLHSKSCHPKKSIVGIEKGVALRLKRICSTDQEFNNKRNEYSKYLVNRGHTQPSVNKAFKSVSSMTRDEARTPKGHVNKNFPITFTSKYNPRGPNIKSIVQKNLHILEDDLKNDILVSFKRESNLKELILRADPYQIKTDLLDHTSHSYKACEKSCDSCKNYVDEISTIRSSATGRIFHIKRDSSCNSKNIIYVAYCTLCGKQGVGSTTNWKPRLANYKSHIKMKRLTCRIVRHFVEECVDNSLSNLRFIIVDKVNNTEGLDQKEIDNLLLKKEKFWIGTLVTQHQGLNGKHDWNRKTRTEREKTE
mgnify:FL=1